jgi:hypothetical protein
MAPFLIGAVLASSWHTAVGGLLLFSGGYALGALYLASRARAAREAGRDPIRGGGSEGAVLVAMVALGAATIYLVALSVVSFQSGDRFRGAMYSFGAGGMFRVCTLGWRNRRLRRQRAILSPRPPHSG